METVKQQEAEDNFVDLSGSEAGSRMQEMVKQAETCFFCTETLSGQGGVRPMSVLKADDDGRLYVTGQATISFDRQKSTNCEHQSPKYGLPKGRTIHGFQ